MVDSSATFEEWLPSFNLRVDLTDDWIARFAVSKAVAWPDMSEVRNQAVIGARQVQVQYLDADEPEDVDPDEPVDEGRDIRSVSPVQWIGSEIGRASCRERV